MLIAALDGETVDPDRLPGDLVPWNRICDGARCIRFDEVSGIVYVWCGRAVVEAYDTCGRLIDFWTYPAPPTLAIVIGDMQRRSGACSSGKSSLAR